MESVQRKFQSLLHQGISLLRMDSHCRRCVRSLFQSLLHQGISLLVEPQPFKEELSFSVSIPSSSGHQFTVVLQLCHVLLLCRRFNPFFIRASVYCAAKAAQLGDVVRVFQSLLHQGISLLMDSIYKSSLTSCSVSIPSSSGHQFTGSGMAHPSLLRIIPVSIPSSSGHQFTVDLRYWFLARLLAAFQSLLHQGISLLADDRRHAPVRGQRRFNPFFIRASVYCSSRWDRRTFWGSAFQSLLHQGISLLN